MDFYVGELKNKLSCAFLLFSPIIGNMWMDYPQILNFDLAGQPHDALAVGLTKT